MLREATRRKYGLEAAVGTAGRLERILDSEPEAWKPLRGVMFVGVLRPLACGVMFIGVALGY